MSKRKPAIIDGIIDYDGPAVYALIDDNGKAYIGSTVNFKRRMMFHTVHFRKVISNPPDGWVSQKLQDALLDGHRFRVEVLASFPDGVTHEELVSNERAFFYDAGGLDDTYNCRVPVV